MTDQPTTWTPERLREMHRAAAGNYTMRVGVDPCRAELANGPSDDRRGFVAQFRSASGAAAYVAMHNSLGDLLAEIERQKARADKVEACMELVAGNVANFLDKREDAPCSADAHLDEAMRLLVDHRPSDGKYSEAAAKMRLELWRDDYSADLRKECAKEKARADAFERERDAYRKAKQENDERFCIERDEARAEVERLRAELATVTKREADGVALFDDLLARERAEVAKLRAELAAKQPAEAEAAQQGPSDEAIARLLAEAFEKQDLYIVLRLISLVARRAGVKL